MRIERYAVAYDVGRAVNPQLIEGQIRGGLAQGVGGALFEELAYDENGTLVSGSFMDYLIPTADEVPAVRVLVTEEAPTPAHPARREGRGRGRHHGGRRGDRRRRLRRARGRGDGDADPAGVGRPRRARRGGRVKPPAFDYEAPTSARPRRSRCSPSAARTARSWPAARASCRC